MPNQKIGTGDLKMSKIQDKVDSLEHHSYRSGCKDGRVMGELFLRDCARNDNIPKLVDEMLRLRGMGDAEARGFLTRIAEAAIADTRDRW